MNLIIWINFIMFAVFTLFFCYQYFYDPISGVSVKETQTERDAFVPLLKTISWTGNSKQ